MIRLSNGHPLDYVAASGALGYDGQGWLWEQPLRLIPDIHSLPNLGSLFDPRLFTAVTKTLTPQRLRGNPYWDSVRLIPDGVVNAVGLKNPGFGSWCQRVGPKLQRKHQAVIVSITADDIDHLELMAGRLNSFDIVGVELNASCPNTDNQFAGNSDFVVAACRAIKTKTHLPLLLKLSVTHQAEDIVPRLSGTVEALSVNSVPWSVMFPNHASPLAQYGGGAVSGGAAQKVTWAYAERLHRLTHIPIIGPSIWWFEDMMELRAKGMSALGFGSIWLRYPWKPTLYARHDRAIQRRKFRHRQRISPYCT